MRLAEAFIVNFPFLICLALNPAIMADFVDSTFVVPGQFITSEKTYLRGHGSFIQDSSEGYQLLSCVAGQIERIDKLIAVKPVKSR